MSSFLYCLIINKSLSTRNLSDQLVNWVKSENPGKHVHSMIFGNFSSIRHKRATVFLHFRFLNLRFSLLTSLYFSF